jgi:pimeloyl-ACP methyl ester carboxylesterase
MNAKDMYGAPNSMALFDAYHERVTADYDLAEAMVMEGFSRGGLYAVNYAALHPERVAALYLDAPALDIRSWPGRKHSGWQQCLDNYGIVDSEVEIDRVNPIGRVETLLAARIPIVAVSGDADRSVPYLENLAILEARYVEKGGEIEVILKPGAGHSPHSLNDPTPVVDFILQHANGFSSTLD